MMRLVHFLGNETAYREAVFECVEENLVAPIVKLLDLLALHIRLAGVAELAAETRCCEFTRDALGDQFDPLHDQREVCDRDRSTALGHEVPGESDAAGHLHYSYALLLKRSPGASVCRDHQGCFERSPRTRRGEWSIHRPPCPFFQTRLP